MWWFKFVEHKLCCVCWAVLGYAVLCVLGYAVLCVLGWAVCARPCAVCWAMLCCVCLIRCLVRAATSRDGGPSRTGERGHCRHHTTHHLCTLTPVATSTVWAWHKWTRCSITCCLCRPRTSATRTSPGSAVSSVSGDYTIVMRDYTYVACEANTHSDARLQHSDARLQHSDARCIVTRLHYSDAKLRHDNTVVYTIVMPDYTIVQ